MKLSLRAALLPNNLEQTLQKIMFWLVQAFHWPIVEAFSREEVVIQCFYYLNFLSLVVASITAA